MWAHNCEFNAPATACDMLNLTLSGNLVVVSVSRESLPGSLTGQALGGKTVYQLTTNFSFFASRVVGTAGKARRGPRCRVQS